MYKKITHTIFEEQFAHPATLDIVDVKKDVKSKMVDSTLPNILRRQVREIMSHYTGRMRDSILANVNGTGDSVLGAQLAGAEVSRLAEIAGRYYPAGTSNALFQSFSIVTSTTLEMAKAIKNGTDLTALAADNAAGVEALATALSVISTAGWTKDDTVAIFTEITTNWLEQVRTRMRSEWSADFRLIAKNESYLVAGTPVITSFPDSFTNSIIMSFPAQF